MTTRHPCESCAPAETAEVIVIDGTPGAGKELWRFPGKSSKSSGKETIRALAFDAENGFLAAGGDDMKAGL